MQFPESWLREFCNPPISTNELADLLTMAGLEVEEMTAVAPPFPYAHTETARSDAHSTTKNPPQASASRRSIEFRKTSPTAATWSARTCLRTRIGEILSAVVDAYERASL